MMRRYAVRMYGRHEGVAVAKVIVGVTVSLVVVAGVVMYATGWLYAGFKKPNEVYALASTVTPVCTSSDIVQYNSHISDAKKITEQFAEIKNRHNYAQDPTCVFIELRSYMREGNSDKFSAAISGYKALIADGKNPSADLIDIASVSRLESEMKMIKSMPKESGTPGDVQG